MAKTKPYPRKLLVKLGLIRARAGRIVAHLSHNNETFHLFGHQIDPCTHECSRCNLQCQTPLVSGLNGFCKKTPSTQLASQWLTLVGLLLSDDFLPRVLAWHAAQGWAAPRFTAACATTFSGTALGSMCPAFAWWFNGSARGRVIVATSARAPLASMHMHACHGAPACEPLYWARVFLYDIFTFPNIVPLASSIGHWRGYKAPGPSQI